MIDKYIDKDELARRIGCTTRHIENLVRAGKIPVTRIGRLCRFDWLRCVAALEKYTQKAIGE